ncbi:helix-turn-helix domain-containing protein [Hymenobacter sp. GOD-10R]|uniref:helix-turn-helix domain-containing protein n=1 Tax=Hymenobacter sp. GOD-10R TaxID=3093922 RepID=UPI002D76FB2E|nr:helix-turn-helix domain-containing protein [Hymenobacter sp. GOD-10R]WRQ28403.1 helix-turn-helix domain-containing protein [Hymenobacter sp. GOD-10R]
MQAKYIDINSISELHHLYGLPKPKHPLVSLFDLTQLNRSSLEADGIYRLGFYSIYYKKFTGALKYGKAYYDFNEGPLMFTAPGQVITPSPDLQIEEGWGLVFHPDLLNRTELGRKITSYSFFHYDANEALHISEEEKLIIEGCVENIKREYSQNIDQHTQSLIQNNIELLLNYCDRFYNRQFLTRANVSNDLVQRFEKLLKAYFAQETLIEAGLPDVKFFAAALHLSPHYLSDLLKRYTGKTTQEHIHLHLTDKAKALLWSTEKSISEIAYDLGFEHPSHFTKIFKTKTGKSPTEYRYLN